MSEAASTNGRKPVAWARVYAAFKPERSKNLRHGTWYPVLADDLPDRVTLLVASREVNVPRSLVEIRDRRPNFFTVVGRSEPPPSPAPNLGKRYAVCPECKHRSTLFGTPEKAQCKKCGHQGDVAWWDF